MQSQILVVSTNYKLRYTVTTKLISRTIRLGGKSSKFDNCAKPQL